MINYKIIGPKENDIKTYQTINYIEKNLAEKEITEDKIAAYNQALVLVYKWLMQAISARKKDIVSRMYNTKNLK